jgi:cellulose biosynthesis protein BcsQ
MGKIFTEGIVVSFVNQKGGVGKSTLTSIFANYLHTTGRESGFNLKIAVVDADDRQKTLSRKRNRELLQMDIDENASEIVKKTFEDNSYKVIEIASKDVSSQIDFLKEEYDIILLDLPGNMMQEGVITDYFLIDIMIIPFQPNEFDLDSTILFYQLLKTDVLTVRSEQGFKTTVAAVMNRVNPTLLEFKEIVENREAYPFSILTNYVKDSKVAYQRNINTLGESTDKDTHLCEEILSLIYEHQES